MRDRIEREKKKEAKCQEAGEEVLDRVCGGGEEAPLVMGERVLMWGKNQDQASELESTENKKISEK